MNIAKMKQVKNCEKLYLVKINLFLAVTAIYARPWFYKLNKNQKFLIDFSLYLELFILKKIHMSIHCLFLQIKLWKTTLCFVRSKKKTRYFILNPTWKAFFTNGALYQNIHKNGRKKKLHR